MPKNFSRTRRLEEQILQETAAIIYYHVKDPRMGFITLTDVELNKDLRYATVYYTVLEEKEKNPTQEALKHSKGFIRTELAKCLTMYQVPELIFKYDTNIERGAHIANIIDQISQKEKKDL